MTETTNSTAGNLPGNGKSRRDHPRVAVDFAVEFEIESLIHSRSRSPSEETFATALTARVVNLSPAGFQIACDRELLMLLVPNSTVLLRKVRYLARLQVDGSRLPLAVGCQPVFSRRVAEDTYRVGFQFCELDPESSEVVTRLVDAHEPLSLP